MTALSTLLNAAMDDSRRSKPALVKKRKKGRKVARRRNAKGLFLKGPAHKRKTTKRHDALDAFLDSAFLDSNTRKKRSDAGKKRKKKSVRAYSGCTPAMKAAMNKLCQDMDKRAKEKAQAEANTKLAAAIDELRTAAGSWSGYAKGHPGIPTAGSSRSRARR